MNQTAGQFAIDHSVGLLTLVEGRTTLAALEAAVPNWRDGIVARRGGSARVRALVAFASAAAEDAERDFRVWAGIFGRVAGEGPPPDAQLHLIGHGTATVGATVAAAGTIAAGLRIADAIAWTRATDATTPKGPGAMIETGLGAADSAAHSPGGDGTAQLLLTDVGPADFLIFEGVDLVALAATFT